MTAARGAGTVLALLVFLGLVLGAVACRSKGGDGAAPASSAAAATASREEPSPLAAAGPLGPAATPRSGQRQRHEDHEGSGPSADAGLLGGPRP